MVVPTQAPDNAAYGHFVQFYENDDFLIREVAGFLGAGLRTGAAGIVLADPEHRRTLRASLACDKAGADEGYGPLFEFDAAEVLARILVNGRPDEALFRGVMGVILKRASDGGSRRVRIYGELVALLCAQDRHQDALALEVFWNGLARSFEFKLFCGYPMKVFASGDHAVAFEHVCRAHALVRPAEGGATSNMGAAAGRTVAALQQKTHALNAELTRRRAAERALLSRDKAFADFVTNAVGALYRTCVGAGNLERVRRERDDLLLRSPVGAALLGGPEHRFELANSLFEELFARYSLVGKPFREAFPELVATDVPALLDRAYDAGTAFVVQASTFALHSRFAGDRSTACFTLIGQSFRQSSCAEWSTTVVALDPGDRPALGPILFRYATPA